MRDIAAGLAELSIAAERVGAEIVRLQSTELAELSEPISPEHVGSSTMPQKRNPHSSELMVSGARLLRGALSSLGGSGIHAHERDLGAWAVEWISIPEGFILASGLAHHLRHIAAGLAVDPARMAANLQITQGQIMAESIMMGLAVHLGHEPAHEIVAAATRAASAGRAELGAVLAKDARITAALGREEIRRALEPRTYLGESEAVVDAVLAEAGRQGIAR
jgi:adenylosuccinate lyase/3-carboxy-cis,cis-muconate cycloisomerase